MPIDKPERRKSTEWGSNINLALLLLGAFAGIFQIAGSVGFGAGFEMVALGQNLAASGNYANPFVVLKTGPTAANPPAYPVFLALLNWLLKIPHLVALVATAANIFASALIAAWLPRVSRVFYARIEPGVAAAILWAFSFQLMPAWDTCFTLALLLLFCIYSTTYAGTQKIVTVALISGAIVALLFLFNPSTLLIVLPWIAYQLAIRKWSIKQSIVMVAAMAILILPWVGRNYIQLGAFVVRTNFGMTLYSSNNDCAEPSLLADEARGCYQTHHPNTSLNEAELLQRLGEVSYDRLRTADAMAWIKAHSDYFWQLTWHRFVNFWFPPAEGHPFKAAVIWITTILSIPGLYLMIRSRERVTFYAVLVLLMYPVLYYIVVSDVRYRYPILWLSELPAGYCLWRAWVNIDRRIHGF